MTRGGGALAIGSGSGQQVQQAIEKALHHPLLDDIDLYSATGMIANFTGSSNMSFKDVTDALHTLQQATGSHADIIPGIITDPRMEDRVQLILIVTGIGKKQEQILSDLLKKRLAVLNKEKWSKKLPSRITTLQSRKITTRSAYPVMETNPI